MQDGLEIEEAEYVSWRVFCDCEWVLLPDNMIGNRIRYNSRDESHWK